MRRALGSVAMMAAAVAACQARESDAGTTAAPVTLNPEATIQYPPRLYDRGVDGDVVLRLFVDSTGRMVPESSRVAKSSGHAALDSAALTGAQRLRFAPARRRGVPVSAAFLQPIEFRHDASTP